MPETITFGPLEVAFDGEVLVPRPWTLLQSEWAVEVAASLPAGPVLELCAGVGHIGLVVVTSTGRRLVQVDADPDACAYARRNADAAGVSDLVEVREADLAGAVAPDERFPLILADPPYVPTRDVDEEPDDPAHAIDGGESGLDLVDECLRVSAAHVTPGGVVLLQVGGPTQAEAVKERLPAPLAVEAVRVVDDRRAVVLLRART